VALDELERAEFIGVGERMKMLISEEDYVDFRVEHLTNVLSGLGIPRDCEEIRYAYLEAHNYAHKIGRGELPLHCLGRLVYLSTSLRVYV